MLKTGKIRSITKNMASKWCILRVSSPGSLYVVTGKADCLKPLNLNTENWKDVCRRFHRTGDICKPPPQHMKLTYKIPLHGGPEHKHTKYVMERDYKVVVVVGKYWRHRDVHSVR